MLGLDLDLMLAPLEDNRFNRCKSNLRVLEAGMIGACAIAQRLDPYLDGAPPVFAYAETPDEWTQAVEVDRAIRESDYREGVAKVRAQQFTHRSLVPLDQVDLRTDAEIGQNDLFDHECDGHCGV
jgi:hypothetical protein